MTMDTFFPYQLAVAAAALSGEIEDVYRREGGLSREEWRLLFLLADVEALTSKELSRRSSLDKVQISRAAHRLEEKGLISGQRSTQDRRLRDYACTDAGRAHFHALFPRVQARAEEVMGRMDPADRAALTQGVDGLIRASQGTD
ncbi:MarR family transcriptional regulator [Maritimibacter sp. UBA3975]|uniref:MarR family winged helix-turn-helix transcriptional regulator n=1 Tax=Maritimibacter sp. UBA3975 TaxID=1946833 RepID=UPI0025C2C47A|nr:MarR family transcriptional regulator [Maritimibacter sp. UBA3975]